MLARFEAMQSTRQRGQVLVLALAGIAPGVAWAAHEMLGLHLRPGLWTGWASGIWAWIWVLALAPALEELVMRPLLQSGFREQLGRLGGIHWSRPERVGDWHGHLANGATALVFAALHLPANELLTVWWLVPALAIGEVWRRGGKWAMCALLHAWFNACLVLATVLGSPG